MKKGSWQQSATGLSEARTGRRNIPAKPQGEVGAPREAHAGRRNVVFFSPRSPKIPLAKRREARGRESGSGEQRQISKFSLFFSLFFFLPRLIPPEIGRRWSKSTVTARNRSRRLKSTATGQFRVVTRRKQSQSMVLPGSERSACWFAVGPICTKRYPSVFQTLVASNCIRNS
ncbi:hypothetical protein B296_00053640 [Ensete ventricosum]|uniref:Uncharacterized protein n=1 Tax=Ensete ventricosum TaxID=4639 RepID=A0A426Y7C6_ENSVE|nr:hypothetical protein B296_00053640 [Ensete ventricosum]